MSTTQSEGVQLAKRGDPKAIAALMNRSLQSKGISVTAFIQKSRLNIFLESAEVPPEEVLIAIIRKGLNNLHIETIQTVRVHGKQIGSDLPSWVKEFPLESYVSSPDTGRDAIAVASTTVHPVQRTQPVSVSSRNIAQANKQPSSPTTPWIPLLAGITGIAAFALIGLVGSIVWVRSAQSRAISDAQELIESVVEGKKVGSIEALKTDQENLQEAIALLQDVPKFPLVNLGDLKKELSEAETQLGKVEESIATYETLMPQILAVVDQFSALDSALDVGMNYRDYGAEVREIKVALDRLGREPGAADQPVYSDLKDAYTHYEFAYNVWNYYIESDETNSFFSANSSYGRVLMNTYNVEPTDVLTYKMIYLDSALSTVWEAARQKVESAQAKMQSLSIQ